MKKIILSAAVAAMAFSTSAMAADKGIDIDVSGQATIYYQTMDDNGVHGIDLDGDDVADRSRTRSMFDQDDSTANVGIQLNLGADLGNNFTFGSQLTYLGTAGLEKNLVSDVRQTAGAAILVNGNDTTADLALTKIFIAKQIANTTLKIGRQELPKSLSPLAFSEGWNVYKNTFDAIVAINTDIPKTTLVAAYVAGGTGMTLGTTGNLVAATNSAVLGTQNIDDTAYMITASTTAIPMTTVTASYYHLSQVADATAIALGGAIGTAGGIGADAYWLNVGVADKSLPVGLKIGLQAGQIKPDSLSAPLAATILAAENKMQTDDTTMFGAKISLAPVDALTLGVAYTSVDGSETKVNVAMRNTATGDKTPLFTQMVANQAQISLDADTLVLKAAYNTGSFGTFSVAYGMVDAGRGNLSGLDDLGNAIDYNELDLVYKIKAGGVQYFAAYVNQDWDAAENGNVNANGLYTRDATKADFVRVWARYNF